MKVETAKTVHRPVEGPARVRCARKEALKQAVATLVLDGSLADRIRVAWVEKASRR